jgi:VIT1/CCC1 family predicted Fe2+/Mn2+ transporter
VGVARQHGSQVIVENAQRRERPDSDTPEEATRSVFRDVISLLIFTLGVIVAIVGTVGLFGVWVGVLVFGVVLALLGITLALT